MLKLNQVVSQRPIFSSTA